MRDFATAFLSVVAWGLIVGGILGILGLWLWTIITASTRWPGDPE